MERTERARLEIRPGDLVRFDTGALVNGDYEWAFQEGGDVSDSPRAAFYCKFRNSLLEVVGDSPLLFIMNISVRDYVSKEGLTSIFWGRSRFLLVGQVPSQLTLF